MNLSLPKLNRPLLLAAALLIVAAVLLFSFATGALRDRIVEENAQIQKIHAKRENDRRKVSRLPDFQKQAAEADRDGSKLRLLLPEDRVVDFIREVESVARSAGGTVSIAKGDDLDAAKKAAAAAAAKNKSATDTTTTSPAQQDGSGLLGGLPNGKTLGLTLTFSGKYPDAVNFLHKVETAPYFLNVLSMNIRPVDSQQDRSVVRPDVFSAPTDGTKTTTPTATDTPSADTVKAEFDIVVYLK